MNETREQESELAKPYWQRLREGIVDLGVSPTERLERRVARLEAEIAMLRHELAKSSGTEPER